MYNTNYKPTTPPPFNWVVTGIFIGCSLLAYYIRFSIAGFMLLGAIYSTLIGTVLQVIAYKAFVDSQGRFTGQDRLLIALLNLFYITFFAFQEDYGDDIGNYAIGDFIGIKDFTFPGIEAIVYIGLAGYFACFIYILWKAYYLTHRKRFYREVGLVMGIALAPMGFALLYVIYSNDNEIRAGELNGDYERIPVDKEDYETVKKIRFYRYPNMYTHIPKETFKLSNLEELEFYSQDISVLPADVGKLKKLRRINGSNCTVKKIPKEIGQLQNLEELDLFGNEVDSIPDAICDCKKLKVLQVGGPKLRYIPDCLNNLKLEKLAIQSTIWYEETEEFKRRFPKPKQVMIYR